MHLRYLQGERGGGAGRLRPVRRRARRGAGRKAGAEHPRAAGDDPRRAQRRSRSRGATSRPACCARRALVGRAREQRSRSLPPGPASAPSGCSARRRPGQDAADGRIRGRGHGRAGSRRRSSSSRRGRAIAGVPYASLGRALRAVIERVPARARTGAARTSWRGCCRKSSHAVVAAAGATRRPTLVRRARGSAASTPVPMAWRRWSSTTTHFADSASLEMLQGLVLAERPRRSALGLRAQRPAEGEAAVEALATALEEAHRVEFVALGALDEPAMREAGRDRSASTSPDPARLAPLPRPPHRRQPALCAGDAQAPDCHRREPRSTRACRDRRAFATLIERRLRQLSPDGDRARPHRRDRRRRPRSSSPSRCSRLGPGARRPVARARGRRRSPARSHAFAHDLVLEATLAGVPAPIAARMRTRRSPNFPRLAASAPARVASHWIASGQPQRARAALQPPPTRARQAMRRKEEAGSFARRPDRGRKQRRRAVRVCAP